MAPSEGTTPSAWTAASAPSSPTAWSTGAPAPPARAPVAGETAQVVEDTCRRRCHPGRSLVHGSRGWYFTTRGTDDAATTALLDDLVASIEFTDD